MKRLDFGTSEKEPSCPRCLENFRSYSRHDCRKVTNSTTLHGQDQICNPNLRSPHSNRSS